MINCMISGAVGGFVAFFLGTILVFALSFAQASAANDQIMEKDS